MEPVVGENVDGVEVWKNPAVEVQLGAEEDAVEGDEIGLETVVIVVVKLGRVRKEIYVRRKQCIATERNMRQTPQVVHGEELFLDKRLRRAQVATDTLGQEKFLHEICFNQGLRCASEASPLRCLPLSLHGEMARVLSSILHAAPACVRGVGETSGE